MPYRHIGARPSTMTREPRGMSGSGGSGSAGVMGEETAMEYTTKFKSTPSSVCNLCLFLVARVFLLSKPILSICLNFLVAHK